MDFDTFLDLDETDKKIIELIQKNPDMTHNEIAEQVQKTQQAVGARFIKLKRKHLLIPQYGAEFNELDLKLGHIEIIAKFVDDVWNRLKLYPEIVNAYKSTGEYNINMEVAAPSLKAIEQFVDTHIRSDPDVIGTKVNYVIASLRPHIVPLIFNSELGVSEAIIKENKKESGIATTKSKTTIP